MTVLRSCVWSTLIVVASLAFGTTTRTYAFTTMYEPILRISGTQIQSSINYLLLPPAKKNTRCFKNLGTPLLPALRASINDDDDDDDEQDGNASETNDGLSSLSNSNDTKNIDNDGPCGVRFLGRGPNAIVRPGVVLVAPANEFHHYYRKAAIFVHAMGESDEYEGEYMIRGLIIDHPTPFSLKELVEEEGGDDRISKNILGENMVFRGGDKGKEGVVLLHCRPELGQEVIGNSGLYQGGWEAALEACGTVNDGADAAAGSSTLSPEDFKVFFNYCEFSEKELEDMLDSNEDGEAWVSVEIDPRLVLDADWERGDCWSRLRNAVAQNYA